MYILEKIEKYLNEETAYQKFFNKKLKKFGVKSQAELKGDQAATEEARKHNVAATAESKPPPAVAASGATPPVAEPKLPQPKSREEMEEWFEEGAEAGKWD